MMLSMHFLYPPIPPKSLGGILPIPLSQVGRTANDVVSVVVTRRVVFFVKNITRSVLLSSMWKVTQTRLKASTDSVILMAQIAWIIPPIA